MHLNSYGVKKCKIFNNTILLMYACTLYTTGQEHFSITRVFDFACASRLSQALKHLFTFQILHSTNITFQYIHLSNVFIAQIDTISYV